MNFSVPLPRSFTSPVRPFVCAACAVFAAFMLHATAAPGDLDLTFGGTGKVVTAMTGDAAIMSVTVQKDGKIVAGGFVSDNFAVNRYNPDGSLDTSFNGSGKVITAFAGFDRIACVAVQDDGKILAAGGVETSGPDFGMVRYNPDGSFDTSFNGSGIVRTDILNGSQDFLYGMALQKDGKIVLTGYLNKGTFSTAVLRYNPDGSLDSSFGEGGKAITTLPSVDIGGIGAVVQADGKIVTTGGFFDGTYNRPVVLRFNANGTPDESFGNAGSVMTEFGYEAHANSLTLQDDGKIVIAGFAAPVHFSNYEFALVRYHPDGSLDESFNGTGKVVTPLRGGPDICSAVAVQRNGKIVAAGWSRITDNDFAVVRYTAGGELDTSFNGTGKVITAVGTGWDSPNAMALQSDGKIILAGSSQGTGSSGGFALVRYTGDPPIGIPSVTTMAAESVRSASAVLRGTVNSRGGSSSVFFEYGLTTQYGSAIDAVPAQVTGTTDEFVSGTISGLTPYTVYHYRVVAVNSTGLASGADATFSTGLDQPVSEAWRLKYFNTAAHTGDAADLSDPDGDGVVNLLEFATGSSPVEKTVSPGAVTVNANNLELTYTRLKDALGELTYVLEWTESLSGTWSRVGAVTTTVLSDDGVTQTVISAIPAGSNGRRFVRLRVTRK